VHGHFDDARRTAGEDLGALAEAIFKLDVPVEPLAAHERTVIIRHREVPFWDTGRDFAGWFRGYFSPGDLCDPARILDGLPLGDALRETG
jgi:hypothetical protein